MPGYLLSVFVFNRIFLSYFRNIFPSALFGLGNLQASSIKPSCAHKAHKMAHLDTCLVVEILNSWRETLPTQGLLKNFLQEKSLLKN